MEHCQLKNKVILFPLRQISVNLANKMRPNEMRPNEIKHCPRKNKIIGFIILFVKNQI
jgi:hypothetical protein